MIEKYEKQIAAVVENVVNAVHDKKYENIAMYVDECRCDDLEKLGETLDEFLKGRGSETVDKFGVKPTFHSEYTFPLLNIYDDWDYHRLYADYELTLDTELILVSLKFEFEIDGETLQSIFHGIEYDDSIKQTYI